MITLHSLYTRIMWKYIIRLILRQRLVVLITLGLLTLFMAWQATQIKMSYEMALMLPDSDTTVIKYNRFKKLFGQDGSVLYLGIQDPKINELQHFNQWYDLTQSLREVDGVEESLSIAKTFIMVKDDSLRKFKLSPIFEHKPQSQKELDSLLAKVYGQPFYDGLLYNKENHSTLLAVTLDKNKINSKNRFELLNDIRNEVDKYEAESEIKVHYSGLPYIRTISSKMIKDELLMFTLLTLFIASLMLYFFFKSFKAVFYPMLIVIISVIWTMGFLNLFGYQITILTGILPPLIIVLAVENNIFLLNKYHSEYKQHRNKIKALSRMIQRVGSAMLLTNLTTAVGFAAFIITRNELLTEFGVVASLSIMMVFILSLFLIPVFFSYVSAPKERHVKHLDRKGLHKIVEGIITLVETKRTAIYTVTIIIIIFGFYGMSLMKTTGNVVDDIPQDHPMYQDMLYFEKQFNGILPFEIMIDTKKPKGVMKMATLKRISRLQDTLATYPQLSKSVSVADVVKVIKQAYYNGDPDKYSLPNSYEQAFILKYLPKDMSSTKGKRTILNSFVDTNMQITRISVQMANLSSPEIRALRAELRPKIDSIFKPNRYDVTLTGTSVVFLEGTTYLTDNLIYSLILAIIVIGFIMTLLFTSFKMVSISLIPNLIPQLMTVALMGYFGIPLKPSTILIFSIALGISVDNTIHYLSRYRMELKLNNFNIKVSVINALRETANSMIYSSIVLFLGFSVFMLSSFGGTQSLGKLISFTLLTAMLSNLVLLPSLLLTLDKRLTTKAFEEPFLEIFDEEDDIELDYLEIEKEEE
ncbi:MAG: RND family transporter [Bacteroidetes bacterium]|nr:MAG: RND family transporter [Bacteroidota bacterium]